MLQALLQLLPLFDPAALGCTYQLEARALTKHKIETNALRATAGIALELNRTGFVRRLTFRLIAAALKRFCNGGKANSFCFMTIINTMIVVISVVLAN